MQLIQRLDAIIAERHLLNHKFYQAWSRGELSQEILQRYAAQYYHQVKSFPLFISRTHTRCPNIKVRQVLVDNLYDEDMHDHPALWMKFAQGMGVSRADVLDEVPIRETEVMVNKFYELAERSWEEGLCALYAYECQVPEVSASKIAGLVDFYGIKDEETLAFFKEHQVYDVEHSKGVAELIEQYVEPERAERATREAADALWGFLDGMCRIGNIACEGVCH